MIWRGRAPAQHKDDKGMKRNHYQVAALWLTGCLALSACGTTDPPPPRGQTAAAVDFSGAWEVDYSQSDNVRDRYELMIRELQREAERRARGGNHGGAISVGGSGVNSGASIYGLARMAELITEIQLLDIAQDIHRISVKREGSFALRCEFHPGQLHAVETPLGREVCGWDGHQLVFQIYLPEGLSIFHRLTLGPHGQRLNIATTVRSDQVAYPFSLNRVFNRYDPANTGIRCKQTLTRGRVCTTEDNI